MRELRYCTTGVVLYLELTDVFINSPLQTAIDALYDTSCGHEEGVHKSVPVEETRPPSPRTGHSLGPSTPLPPPPNQQGKRKINNISYMTCYVGVHKDEHGGHVTSVYTVTYLLISLSLSTIPLDPTQPTTTV